MYKDFIERIEMEERQRVMAKEIHLDGKNFKEVFSMLSYNCDKLLTNSPLVRTLAEYLTSGGEAFGSC